MSYNPVCSLTKKTEFIAGQNKYFIGVWGQLGLETIFLLYEPILV